MTGPENKTKEHGRARGLLELALGLGAFAVGIVLLGHVLHHGQGR